MKKSKTYQSKLNSTTSIKNNASIAELKPPREINSTSETNSELSDLPNESPVPSKSINVTVSATQRDNSLFFSDSSPCLHCDNVFINEQPLEKLPDQLLNIKTVAKFLACSTKTVRRLIRYGKLSVTSVSDSSKGDRISLASLNQFLADNEKRRCHHHSSLTTKKKRTPVPDTGIETHDKILRLLASNMAGQ